METSKWNVEIREKQYPWMTDDQFECMVMLCDLVGGHHHIQGKIKPCGKGIEIDTQHHGFSTYDFAYLTQAVIMAHDRKIRFEIDPHGRRTLRISLHKRHKRIGQMHERHPTIEDAIHSLRQSQGYDDKYNVNTGEIID